MIREDLLSLVRSSLSVLLALHNILLILEAVGKPLVQDDRKAFDLICLANMAVFV